MRVRCLFPAACLATPPAFLVFLLTERRRFHVQNLKGHDYENVVAWVGFALAIGGVIFAFFWNIFYDYDGAAGC